MVITAVGEILKVLFGHPVFMESLLGEDVVEQLFQLVIYLLFLAAQKPG